MQHRSNWKFINNDYNLTYSLSDNSKFEKYIKYCNFLWKDTSSGINYNNNSNNKLVVNHFKNNNCISNKLQLFLNLMRYCEKLNIDVFKYIPFTIQFNYNFNKSNDAINNLNNLYKNINDYLVNNKTDLSKDSSIKEFVYNKYSYKFLNYNNKGELTNYDKLGNKTYISIKNNFYNNKNLWLVKAINLNRARGIKITHDLNEIYEYSKSIFKGIDKNANLSKSIKKSKSILNISINESSIDNLNRVKSYDIIQQNLDTLDNKNVSMTKNKDSGLLNIDSNINTKKESLKFKERTNNIKLVKKSKNNQNKNSSLIKQKIFSNNLLKFDNNNCYYTNNTVLIQKYLEKPFLYNNRKCDLRIWVLIDHLLNAYVFKEGYFRVCSLPFDLSNNSLFVHLTNFSIQKKCKDFSKYEEGNEVNYKTFQVRYIYILCLLLIILEIFM